MRRHGGLRVLALGLLLAVLAAGSAPAFVLTRAPSPNGNGNWYFRRWPAATGRVHYMLNDLSLDMLPNLSSSSTPLAAVQEAMRSWAFAPMQLQVEGTSSVTDAVLDGTNLISFANTPKNRDLTANAVALTLSWARFNGSQWNLGEADTIFNPKDRFATNGAGSAYDIQAVLTHELGHALGLSHSAITAATMFPYTEPGRILTRGLDPDDVAGVRALYHTTDPSMGTIAGQVLTTAGDPVLGAHVVATNADGIVLVGALTDMDGTYTLPSLPADNYQVYAEPLNGVTTPANYDLYHKDALTQFQPAFAVGNLTTTPVNVEAGKTASLDPIKVAPRPASIKVTGLGWSPDGNGFHVSSAFAAPIAAGSDDYLVVIGNNLDAVPDDGIQISGSDVTVDTSNIVRGTTTRGLPFAIVPLSVRDGAAPGPRNLYLDSGTEQAVYTGAVVIAV